MCVLWRQCSRWRFWAELSSTRQHFIGSNLSFPLTLFKNFCHVLHSVAIALNLPCWTNRIYDYFSYHSVTYMFLSLGMFDSTSADPLICSFYINYLQHRWFLKLVVLIFFLAIEMHPYLLYSIKTCENDFSRKHCCNGFSYFYDQLKCSFI